MLVTILTVGSRGDVEPYVALGRGMAASGWRVRIATLAPFESLVQSHGLEFRAVSDPLTGFKAAPGWMQWQSSGVSWWRKLTGLRGLLRDARPALLETFDECLAACEGTEVVLGPWNGIPGQRIAHRVGAVHAYTLLQPITATRAFPHFLWPYPGSGMLNRVTYPLVETAVRVVFDGAVNEWCCRRRVRASRRRSPVIYGFSDVMIPRPADWPEDVHLTGYWLLDPDIDWSPPDKLASFLRDGTDVICVCHGGTSRSAEQKAALETIRLGVESAGYRALLVSRGVETAAGISDRTLVIDSAPYHWLFRRVRVVMHHGGAGTSAAVLRAGRPSIVLPTCFDQPFWAYALERLGAAPAALAAHRLTRESVEQAVREAAGNPCYRHNALACAERLATENGVKAAVNLLRRYFPAV